MDFNTPQKQPGPSRQVIVVLTLSGLWLLALIVVTYGKFFATEICFGLCDPEYATRRRFDWAFLMVLAIGPALIAVVAWCLRLVVTGFVYFLFSVIVGCYLVYELGIPSDYPELPTNSPSASQCLQSSKDDSTCPAD